MKILIGAGDPVRFDEIPDPLDFDTVGSVVYVCLQSNKVMVDVPGYDLHEGKIFFDLDGSSWDMMGRFKHEMTFISLD